MTDDAWEMIDYWRKRALFAEQQWNAFRILSDLYADEIIKLRRIGEQHDNRIQDGQSSAGGSDSDSAKQSANTDLNQIAQSITSGEQAANGGNDAGAS